MMDATVVGDEFAACSIEDIALAVGYGEPGSEDQALALEALRRRLPPGRDHNQPPLTELIHEDLEPFRKRRDALIATAKTAAIIDDETAGKVLDLMQQCRAYETEIDSRRKGLIKPHRDAEKLINDSHNRLRLEVQVARQGMNGSSGLRGLLTAWDDQKRAAILAARETAEQEAEARDTAAQAARERVAEATASGRGVVTAELAAMQADDALEQARAGTAAIREQPLRGHLGQVSRKREILFAILDPIAASQWVLTLTDPSWEFMEALRAIIGKHLRSLGVDAVATGVSIPGVKIEVIQGDAIIRR